MRWIVFLRGVNVGGANLCRPAVLAKQLSKFGVVNVGAVGTFVVREDVSESVLRAAIARKLSFKCEIMIVPACDLIKLASKDPFAREPSGPDITRFVSVLHKRPRQLPVLPLTLPAATGVSDEKSARVRSHSHQTLNIKHRASDDWLLKIIAVENQFVLGVYRRQMKAIGYLGNIEKIIGVPGTVRNWNTIEKVVRILKTGHSPLVT